LHLAVVAGREDGELAVGSGVRASKEDRDALAEYARRKPPAGFGIYQRGAPADGLFVVARGRVVLRSRVRASRGFVPWVAGPGETFGSEGLSSSRRYATDARADEEAETLFLSTARFRAFVREQPQHSLALISQLLAERASLLDRLRELTTLSVEQRVVATLVRMARDETLNARTGASSFARRATGCCASSSARPANPCRSCSVG
jgi:CRP-like cAMP-binding protein